MEDDDAVPEAFVCPIAHEQMVDPVVALDGHSYSRAAIEHWFRQGRQSSPLTNERLASDQLVPNHSLRKAMEQRRDEQPMTINPDSLTLLEELLGEGSYGRVVAGTLTTGRRTLQVAVKTLPAMTRVQERQAFTDEFKKHIHAARHCHGVCLLYGLCERQGRLCIVMKRYEQSLESAIAAAGATGICEERVRRYAESLSRTLQELHESGLVLRDIKPPNILLDAYDQPVFADFGIAVILQTTVHRGTSIAGTWNYMAPEAFEPQAFAEGIGRHTDVWALACVILEMRTGQRPWADMQMQQIMMAVGVHQRTSQFVVRFLSRALSSLPLSFLSFSLPRAPPPLSHYLSLSPAHVCSLTNHHTRYVYRSSDVEGREADKKSAHHHLLLVKVLRGTPLKNQSGLERQALSLPSQSKLATVKAQVKARWARSTTPEGSYPHMMHCEPPFRSICLAQILLPSLPRPSTGLSHRTRRVVRGS